MRRSLSLLLGLVLVCLFVASFVLAQEQQQPLLQEEVIVRWWLVPVYAVDKAGAPVLDLAPEDLEVYIKDVQVEQFSLIKKQFQKTEGKKPAAGPQALAPPQKKMVFLVFDAAFSSYNLMSRAKSIAAAVTAQSDKTAHYVLLSIEPFTGLKYITGPTRDLNEIAKSMKKYVAGKKGDYLFEANAMDKNEIQNVYPSGDPRNPNSGALTGLGRTQGGQRSYVYSGGSDLGRKLDRQDKRRRASSYTSALMTLDLVLGQFREYSKVIYLYSCGIPDDALLNRTEWISRAPTALSEPPEFTVFMSVDTVAYDTLTMIGRHLNKSGSILFLVNPSGTTVDETDSVSGEQSLRDPGHRERRPLFRGGQ